MGQKQLQQNKRQQNQQTPQNQRSGSNGAKQSYAVSSAAEKSSVSEMLAAAEAFALGKTGAKTTEAASFFGNQAMLELAEQSAAQRSGVKLTADVLGGEKRCEFADNAPLNEISAESAFSPESVPDFSPEAPAADINQVGALASEYLL